jgi:pilus assembly protein Flp/PilA
MKNFFLKAYIQAQTIGDDHGQDLIEYALVVALIAFAAMAGMQGVASQINATFLNIGNKVASYAT